MLASIPSPPSNGISLGPLFLHAYGLCYGIAVITAVFICARRWRAQGGDPKLVEECALWGFPAGLIGGRLYHVITSWNEVPHTWWGPFAVWKGGLGIWGGIALGVAVGLWRVKRAHADMATMLDAPRPRSSSPSRSGASATGSTRSCSASRRRCRGAWRSTRAHRPARYPNSPTFHPTFLYEIIWNLSLAGFLVWLGHHRRIRPPGLFALYVAGYSAFRIFEETLRVDPAHHFLGLRLNLFVAVGLTTVGLVWFFHTQRRARVPATAGT